MRSTRSRHGAVMVYTIIVLLILIAFTGLALDCGFVFWTGHQLQNAADAAALAGAQKVHDNHTDARAAAIALAANNNAGGQTVGLRDNPYNLPSGDVVCGIYDRATRHFLPFNGDNANAVRVVARRNTGSLRGPLPLLFGPIFGKRTADIRRVAIAMAEGGPDQAAIIALHPRDPQSFYIYGNAVLNVGTGSVQVDSNSAQAAIIQGTMVRFIASEANIVGEYITRGKPGLPTMNEHQDFVADPLADLADPPIGPAMSPAQISGIRTFNPGYYPQGLNLGDGDNVVLNPGIYVLDNGFRINGHATLTGQGVMFYIKSGPIFTNGTCQIYLTPPTEGDYAGISFFQARTNISVATLNGDGTLTGSPGDMIGTGTFYLPNARIQVGGNSITGYNIFVNRLIASKIEVFGNGTFNVTQGWDGDTGSQKVYLVE